MTPAEINGRIKAYSEAQNRAMERIDALAWMVGSYTAQGYHQPKKYPKKPDMVKTKAKLLDEPEDEELMKDKLTAFASIHNTLEGGLDGSHA